MYTIHLKTNAIEAALLIAPKKDIRHYLNGVFITAGPEGGEIVATNGHMLYRHHVRDCTAWGGEHPRLIIPRAAAEAAVKLAKAQKLEIMPLTISDDAIPVHQLGGLQFEPVDGRYPDYFRVIPDSVKYGQVAKCFNTEYLRTMHKALLIGAGYGSGAKAVVNNPMLQFDRPDGGAVDSSVFSIGAGENMGIIMPVRPPKDPDSVLSENAFLSVYNRNGENELKKEVA